jgi:hypothetical protein
MFIACCSIHVLATRAVRAVAAPSALKHSPVPSQLPHYVAWVNCLRCALTAVLAWSALLLFALVLVTNGHVEEHPMALHSKVYIKYHLGGNATSHTTTHTTTAATTASNTTAAASVHRRRLLTTGTEWSFAETWGQQVVITHVSAPPAVGWVGCRSAYSAVESCGRRKACCVGSWKVQLVQ